jgi:hypothetical protein
MKNEPFPMISRYGGFHKWGIPNNWMVYFMENPIKETNVGVPHFRNLDLSSLDP